MRRIEDMVVSMPPAARRHGTVFCGSMGLRVLDGSAIAAEIKADVQRELLSLEATGVVPGLTVILIGDDPASAIYVRNKVKTCAELGIRSTLLQPSETVTTEELLDLVADLNGRDDVDGILIQLPLPKQVNTQRVLEAVLPDKDVDGFHPVNVGRLHIGQDCLAPCTPAGVMEILRRADVQTEGANAVVVGRSDIVGKPAAAMLLNADATVTCCHIKTVGLARHTREADILVVAIGSPGFFGPAMVKPGAVMIDVGINRVTDEQMVRRFFGDDAKRMEVYRKRGALVMGDISPAACALSSMYTPVPGGVGALTIAMLMHNTVKAAKLRRGML